MFNERYSFLPSLGLIKHVHDVINLLHYKHWTDKWKYIPYLSATQKVLKSCRSKVAHDVSLAHDVSYVHGASTLYKKHVGKAYTEFSLLWGCGSPTTNQKFAHSPHPHQILIPSHQKLIHPNKKIKMLFFSCSHCSCTLFCFNFILFWNTDHANLNLIDVKYSQSAENFFKRQNHSSSGSHHLVKKSPQQCSLLFNAKSRKLLKF